MAAGSTPALGLLLSAFKGKIEQHIEHRLDELLLAAAAAAPAAKSGEKKGGRKA